MLDLTDDPNALSFLGPYDALKRRPAVLSTDHRLDEGDEVAIRGHRGEVLRYLVDAIDPDGTLHLSWIAP